MAKKPTPNFETTLKELESIVTHLESGDLPLEDALNEFENCTTRARIFAKSIATHSNSS